MHRNEQFPAQMVSRVQARTTWADITLASGPVQEIQVQAEGEGTALQELSISHEYGSLVISQPQSFLGLGMLFGRRGQMSVTITLPEDWGGDVELHAVSAPISARQIQCATLRLETVSGDIAAFSLQARSMRLRTVSGGLDASSLSGDELELRSVSGPVNLTGLTFDQVEGSVVSGFTDLRFDRAFRALNLNGVSGGISLSVPSGSLAVQYKTVTGRLQYDGQLSQGDAPRVIVSTVSGILMIYNTAPSA